MQKVLAALLSKLCAVAENHPEVHDSEVRERMDDAVHNGFLIPTPGYRLPDTFAMFSTEGDLAVKEALAEFIDAAKNAAEAEGLDTFHKRLDSFQNLDVTVGPQRMCYNDFFGWAPPDQYDADGNVIS